MRNALKAIYGAGKANPFITAIIVCVLAVLFWYLRGSIKQAWSTHQVEKQDEQLQQGIDASEKAAAATEANANSHRDDRLAGEGRHQVALEEKKAAAENSNRSAEQVRKARQRYEETRRSRTADAPTLSDADLCAELTKRGIDCR